MKNKYDIAIGIPSYNEQATISNVTKQIDIGLSHYFSQLDSVIVNIDNNSADETKYNFLSTETKTQKKYISTQKGLIGKGHNLQNFFNFANNYRVRAAAIFDADLENISPEWINQMLSPILHLNYDFVYPSYSRYRYDGTITNHICYPLIVGIFGIDIRQPIGGDFGFSHLFLKSFLNSPLPPQSCTFGIDIFMTTQAVIQDFRMCSVSLGRKVHRKRNMTSLEPMLSEVTASMFSQINKSQFYKKEIPIITSPTLFKNNSAIETCPEIFVDTNVLENIFFSDFFRHINTYRNALPQEIFHLLLNMYKKKERIFISTDMWCTIIYSILAQYISTEEKESTPIINSIAPLFFAKLLSFIEEINDCTDQEVENYLQKQAHLFFYQRKKIVSLLINLSHS